MNKQEKTVHKKHRGRPPGTRYGETIPVRLGPGAVQKIDQWASAQDVTRSEAIRRLIEKALSKG